MFVENKILAKQKSNNIEKISLYENEIIENSENFLNNIYSGSLFSDKKIITINNGTDKITEQIQDIENNFPKNVSLIIYSNILEKKSKLRNLFEKNSKMICVPCYSDNFKELEIIAIEDLKKNKIALSKESINFIVEKSNNDRNNLKNEIDKIKSFALNQKNLKFDDIKSIINFSGEYKSDIFVNECLSGNVSQYKKILSEFYSSAINQIFLLRILSNKVQRLLNIKKMEGKHKNLEDLLGAAKPPIFWKDKEIVKQQINHWPLEKINNMIENINEIELLIKKNSTNSLNILSNFIINQSTTSNN